MTTDMVAKKTIRIWAAEKWFKFRDWITTFYKWTIKDFLALIGFCSVLTDIVCIIIKIVKFARNRR